MPTGVVSWSQTAASNASADSTVNWTEGQAPSSINDSARALMASVAKYRDDIAGAIVTGGTSTAYTISSNQGFGSLSALANQVIAFTPNATNGATVTLNVDGLGAKPLRSAPGVELPAGVIVQGTPYAALYNSSDSAFYLYGFFINPYSIPIAGSVDYWGSTAPNSSFVLAYGQAISRTTYSALFSLVGTTFGVGDGSTTFNIPDCRGRVIAGKDDMGGSSAARLSAAMSSTTLGAGGGAPNATLVQGNLPATTYSLASGSASVTSTRSDIVVNTNGTFQTSPQGGPTTSFFLGTAFNTSISSTGSATGTIGPLGSGSAFNTIPPTIIANKLIRII